MKLFNKLKNTFKAQSTKLKFVAGASFVAVLATSAVAFATWGPNRPIYDWNKPADRVGSLNGPRFNSFINTPDYGDERAFFDARRSDQTTGGDVYKDMLPDVTKGSQEVVFRTYIHNGANQSTNESGLGVAKNAKVRIALPTGTSTMLQAKSFISADNSAPGYPKEVFDTSELVDSRPFSINYVPGSAKIWTAALNGAALSDNIVTNGALIGDDKLDGNVPGCFEFDAIVEIRVKVKPADIRLVKEVRKAGTSTWSKAAQVKVGEKAQWILDVKNVGQTNLDHLSVTDKLPPHVQVVPGSVRWIYTGVNGQTADVVQSDTHLFAGPVDFGTWKPNGGFFLRFDTTALGNFEGCEVKVTNKAFADSKQTPNDVTDTADLRIVKENCVPKQPVFRCDALSAKLVKDRTYRFTTSVTAQGGATVKQYKYTFGDNTPELLTDKNIVEHEFPEEGTFVTQVVVEFNVNNGVQSHTSAACKVTIDTTKPEVEVPEVLPVTGTGDLIGIFVATTAAGAIAHKFVYGRRYQ